MNELQQVDDPVVAAAQKIADKVANSRAVSAPPAQDATSKLKEFRDAEPNALAQNRLLFDWLNDDLKRKNLYHELEANQFPVLQFKSYLGSVSDRTWPNEDVYLLTGPQDIETALKHYSAQPYRDLGSGGKFMLGLDKGAGHTEQNRIAVAALRFDDDNEVKACAREGVRRALVLPQKERDGLFDLAEVAEDSALRYVELLFGFRDQAHGFLKRFMRGAYRRLTFQIIGRHFVADSGLPPDGSAETVQLKKDLEKEILLAKAAKLDESFREKKGLPKETVIARLAKAYGSGRNEEITMVALGLIAGTIGNVRAAVAIAIRDFFTPLDKHGPLIDQARRAARTNDEQLKTLLMNALVRNPPAAFLARTSTPLPDKRALTFKSNDRRTEPIPEGAHVLLAIGAAAASNETFVFGGPPNDGFLHRCIGERLAKPLILETLRSVLLLPGLSQVIDPASGLPRKLEKRWGVICERYPLRFQRDRLLNQQPLHVVLKIKEPVAQNAEKLTALTRGGAFIVQDALDDRKHVHFAWFMLVEGGTHLAMMTVYDGDFDAYVEHFATQVALFDEQLKLLEDAPPTPVRDHPKEFVEWIRKNNRTPMGGYFYSAYPLVSAAEIANTKTR
jgi:hypothetical protein